MSSHTNGGLFQYGGQPVGGAVGSSPFGDAYFVDYGSGNDAADGKTPNTAVKTLSTAIGLVTSNNNDVIYIDGYSAVVETAMVTLSKNRVTIIGCNGVPGHFGQGARISCTLSATATNIATFTNTGVRNTFVGLKFENANTVDEGLYCVAEGGEYARYYNCSFYKSTDLDDAGAAELLLNGDSAMFYNCTFGSTDNETGNIRANVLCTATLSGKKLRDCYFENCLFWGKADDTDKNFVYGANATDVERMLMFKGCTFFNTELASGVPTAAITFGAKQTEGLVFLKDCSAVNCADIAADDMGIWVDGAAPTEATSGIALELAS
jgi:hypothetical protein